VADTRVVIPDRDSFKPTEVCEIAGVQPYVLRSWEQEFPRMGTSRSQGAPRVYRRTDLERVLRIKELVFVEGLTLAGARRQIEDEEGSAGPGLQPMTVGPETRQKIEGIKQDLRALVEMLGGAPAPHSPSGWLPPVQSSVLRFDGDPDVRPADAAGVPKVVGRKKSAPRIARGG
jgi:DNA-binding transcriptional MerR regulator